MANLLDLVTVSQPALLEEVPKGVRDRWEKAVEIKGHTDHMKSLMPRRYGGDSDKDRYGWADKAISAADKTVQDLLWDTFLDEDNLPVPMRAFETGSMERLRQTPQATMAQILPVVDALHFVILPFEYISSKAWANEDWQMQAAIEAFGKLDEHLDVYVATPPIYFDVEKVIEAENPNKPIHAGRNAQAFMALRLMLW